MGILTLFAPKFACKHFFINFKMKRVSFSYKRIKISFSINVFVRLFLYFSNIMWLIIPYAVCCSRFITIFLQIKFWLKSQDIEKFVPAQKIQFIQDLLVYIFCYTKVYKHIFNPDETFYIAEGAELTRMLHLQQIQMVTL